LYVATFIIVDNSDNTWYLDIDVTNHMTHHNESFVSYLKVWERPICIFGGNSAHEIIGQWEVSIKLNDNTVKEGVACSIYELVPIVYDIIWSIWTYYIPSKHMFNILFYILINYTQKRRRWYSFLTWVDNNLCHRVECIKIEQTNCTK
jgi:hypothetical protein